MADEVTAEDLMEEQLMALARAEYIRMCYLSSLSEEERQKLEDEDSTPVSKWLETT